MYCPKYKSRNNNVYKLNNGSEFESFLFFIQ